MANEWYKNWFDTTYYHRLYGERDDAEAHAFVDTLLQHLQPNADARILDLACGKGRFAKYLAAKGFYVTGVDYSPQSIRFAKQFEHERLSFYIHDMRDPFRMNYYDYIFNFFTSFGYFEHDKWHLRTLQNVQKGLRPHGSFVLDFFNIHYVLANLVTHETKTVGDTTFHIERALQQDFVVKTIRFMAEGREHTFQERVRAFDRATLHHLLQAAQLTVVEEFGDYQLQPFEAQHSKRLILWAQKKALPHSIKP